LDADNYNCLPLKHQLPVLKHHHETIDYLLKIVWQNMANRYNQLVASFDITQSIGYVLINIDEREGTTVSQVAALLGLKSTSLSRMLSQLEKMDLIYRQSSEGDKRSVKIYLTDLGRQKRQMARTIVKQFNAYLNEHLSEKEKQQLTNTLKKINQLTLDYNPE
jgi:MarR family transcriptional regulator, organic hydroperoxide resistance regulator